MEVTIGRKLGPYQLVRETGHGGMSTVYEAVDTRMGRTVAVKVVNTPLHLSPHEREQLLARLQREVRAIGRLSHPNIVMIYDVGEQDGYHYLVMEYLDGVTLFQKLADGPLSLNESADILDQVASGVDAVHAQHFVHRDIKPSNVMLLPSGNVKLMDFGVVREVDDTIMTQTGAMVGTPAYMSPEQVRGESSTAASDIWALGVLLYQMISGHRPFSGPNMAATLYQVAHDAPAPIPGLPAPLQAVLTRALEKDPTRRYSSAQQLAQDFRRVLAAPVLPRVVPKRTRRKVPLFLLLILFVILVFFGLGRMLRHVHLTTKPPAALSSSSSGTRMPLAHAPVTKVQTAVLPTQTVPRVVRHHRRHSVPTPAVHSVLKPVARPAQAFVPPVPFVTHRTETPRLKVSLLGIWQGRHSHNPATLDITHQSGREFSGTMTIHTPEATVRLAVRGTQSPISGEVFMTEERILSSSRPHAWDLGRESGHLSGDGTMDGTATDVRGRQGRWSFSR